LPLTAPLERIHGATAPLPLAVRIGCTLGLVGASFAARQALSPWFPDGGLPFLPFFPAVLLAAAIFARGCGYLATVASGVAACWFIPPIGSLTITDAHNAFSLGLFGATGLACAGIIETLNHALDKLRAEMLARAEAEHGRALLLEEFRHRSRNDLQSLTALLLLRARTGPPEARGALREAAEHALGLARVHTRLAQASAEGSAAVVDTRAFLAGLVHDLAAGAAGDGARPVALVAEAEAHHLSTERAVQLGLVTNECVTNALKYAFPGDLGGQVVVRFVRDGGAYTLTITDDGIGLGQAGVPGPTSGLGTRLLRALAAQLRGRFTREAGAEGGTCCALVFPVPEPGR
jgi:two-component sensor histidine kinase